MTILNKLTPIIILGITLILNTNAKTFPENMSLSDDGNMIITNLKSTSGLYDYTQLKTIYLEFEQSNWWQLLINNYKSKTDLPAKLTYEGKIYENVGVRFRGETSYQRTGSSQKKSFNISIDYQNPDQRLEGYKTLNLNNAFEDPSFMREALYSRFAGVHIPIAKTNFVKLVINGQNWGLYSNVQQLNKDYLNEWFLSNEGTLWRAYSPDTSTSLKELGQQGGF